MKSVNQSVFLPLTPHQFQFNHANATNRPERVIGMHFMNPVPIMKLVELSMVTKQAKQQILR